LAATIERLVQNARQIVHVLHEIIVLGAGPRDADRVAFLECVIADQMRRHLARDDDDRDGVHERVGEPGDGVRRARSRGDEHRADLARRARIAFCRVHGALLVADENVLELVLLKQSVIDRQHRAARVAENMLDTLIDERLDHHFRAGHFSLHRPLHSQVRFALQDPLESKRAPRDPCAPAKNSPSAVFQAVRLPTTIDARKLRMAGHFGSKVARDIIHKFLPRQARMEHCCTDL
jgi:hypothetical protein